MKKIKKFLLLSLSFLSFASCSSNVETIIKSPNEDKGLEGNASNDNVEKPTSDKLKKLLEEVSKIKKYSYEITTNVLGYEGHVINYFTPNAWYEDNDNKELSFGYAQTKVKKEVFKYYLSEDEKNVIPSIYEYAGFTGELEKLTDLYSSWSLTHMNMLTGTLDTFSAIYVSTNKFLITDSETASIFQYATNYGSSIMEHIVGVYIEILDEEKYTFKATVDLGKAGNIECVYKDLSSSTTKIDFVNTLINSNSLFGVDSHSDIYDLFENKIKTNNYVLEGIKQVSNVGESLVYPYEIHCTDNYFYLEYTENFAASYSNYGYAFIDAYKKVTYIETQENGTKISKTQTLPYSSCYRFKKDKNGKLYFDSFIGPIEGDGLSFIEVDEFPSTGKENTLYIKKDENGKQTAYEYREISDGVYGFAQYSSWYNSVADFPINDVSASFYMSSNGLCDIAPLFYEQDRKDSSLYHCKDKDVLTTLANGLFGWGFQATTTWMEYITESRINIYKESNQISSADIALGVNASVNGGEYKEQVVYYTIKDFGNASVIEVEEFLNNSLGGNN